MERQLKATGLFFGLSFFAGAAIQIVQSMTERGTPFFSAATTTRSIALCLLGLLFVASGYVRILSWFQPVVMLALTPFPFQTTHESFYGLGFFVTGILLLFRLGFYDHHRIPKFIVSILYLYLCELAAVLHNGERLSYSLTPIFFITAFLAFLYLAFKEKLVVYLREPKPSFSLKERGLSEAEGHYVIDVARGKNTKEIAAEHSVSESTVRNSLSRAYRKLGVEDRAAIATLAEKYRLVD